MSTQIIRGNALALPLADNSVDLVVTSPPYFGLRSYQDGGEHYDGQIGDEATPTEFVDALVAATAEMVRVTKPTGSIFVNLGDKYAASGGGGDGSSDGTTGRGPRPARRLSGIPAKSLMGIPWRYALRCIDDLGLILRAEIIWSKPNGLPESVTDRVRRSHETWFHFTLSPRYYSAVDEIREAHTMKPQRRLSEWVDDVQRPPGTRTMQGLKSERTEASVDGHPLGKLPGSVWTIPTEPLHVPEHVGVDHFAAYPTEWPRRIIQGWSPRGICTACGEGRRPVVDSEKVGVRPMASGYTAVGGRDGQGSHNGGHAYGIHTITGEACACPEPTAPTTPGTVLDPFGGTGTTTLVADALGRHGIHVDMSADYCRLATWRINDPKQRAKAARREYTPPREQNDGQLDLLEGIA